MMGPNVIISASDAHCIYQTTDGRVLNRGKDVIIGNHCWFTSNIFVFKGVTIADNCIFGAGANVTKDCLTKNALYVGTPAKMIKENVVLRDNLLDLFDSFQESQPCILIFNA